MKRPRSVIWENGEVLLLDQTLLPHQITFIRCGDVLSVAEGIKDMKVRGAPAIGAAAAYGMVLAAAKADTEDEEVFFKILDESASLLKGTRPTAVNLFWAVNRMLAKAKENRGVGVAELVCILLNEAEALAHEDIQVNKSIGRYGASLLRDDDVVLTHCNAGALATVDYGTALGIIRAAWDGGKKIKVYANETRPYLQGARLTTWELLQDGIPVTLIPDVAAGYVMKNRLVTAVIVGADRVAANGDVANKIGTYSLAVLAKENGIPFYVAAPTSTIDLSIATGDEITIEERASEEVTHFRGIRVAPEGVDVFNPSFDITPGEYIDAIISERGILRQPYKESLRSL